MVSNLKWLDLEHLLGSIKISPENTECVFVNADERTDDIDDVHVLFNGISGIEKFCNRIDTLIEEVFIEISQNEKDHWNKNEKEEYLNNIIEYLKHLKSICHYDKASNSYRCENIVTEGPLNDSNLHWFYKAIVKRVHRDVYERYIRLDSKLRGIPDYLSIVNKTRKSTSGNIKIEWKLQLNQLVDFYLRQLELDYIETDKDNLKDFLINNFTYKGKSLSESTINTYFDPNKEIEKLPKKHKKINPTDLI